MRKWTNTLICSLLAISILYSCNNSSSSVSGYTTSPNGLPYRLIKTGGSPKAQIGQYVTYSNTLRNMKGDVFFNSGSNYLGGFVVKPRHKQDPLEVLAMMGVNDSASVIIPITEFLTDPSLPLPAGVVKGDNVIMDIKLHRIYTNEEYTNEILPTLKKAPLTEEKRIQDFIASKGWKAERTPSGLYVVVDNPGKGKSLENGKQVTMNYTGTLLDGTKFDSNVDPAFSHVSPFQFVLGQHAVIQGWDEGVPHFKVGGKGKLIIPANLGYGEQGQPPKIPGNSPLVFDIEVVSVNDAPATINMPQQPIQIQAH